MVKKPTPVPMALPFSLELNCVVSLNSRSHCSFSLKLISTYLKSLSGKSPGGTQCL